MKYQLSTLCTLSFLLICFSCSDTKSTAENKSLQTVSEDATRNPWVMHHVNNDYLIANSLNAGDVDKDGFDDYAVIDENLGLQTIVFHPGDNGNVREPWSRLMLGKTGNPEYSCLGDLDGDGNIDLVVVEGDDLEMGFKTGVAVFWNPGTGQMQDSAAWVKAGHIPGTQGQQYLYSEVHDINGDGLSDIVVGGRRHSVSKEYAGIMWIEAPVQEADRRDLNKWKIHYIDRNALSGHGFVITDIDQDGDNDLVLANADWDTSTWDQELYWYENPGDGTNAQKQPWPSHRIWKSAEFYAKPQVGIGDIDGDGLVDLCTQTQNSIHIFFKKSVDPVEWEHKVVMKPDHTQWIGRPVKIEDVNSDGKMDIVAMLIHNDGSLPKEKASVFWMEYGDDPRGEWTTNVIKWSDGYNSRHQWTGEKWDHCLFVDVDRDGDKDIVGNVEEHYFTKDNGDRESFFSVVWFENPTKPE